MKKFSFIIFSFIILFPMSIYANAGTPLIWAGLGHLFLGNILIGEFETFLLRKEEKKYSIFITGIIIILANFTSMILGFLIAGFLNNSIGIDKFDSNLNDYILQNLIIYLFLTISSYLVEFPFFYWVLKNRNLRFVMRKVIKINTMSAGIILIYYFVFNLLFIK